MASKVPKLELETEYYKILKASAKNKPQKELMKLQWINMMIDRIESAKKIVSAEGAVTLHPRVKEDLETYDVIEVGSLNGKTEKRLVMKKSHTAEIVPLTQSFPIVMKAHKLTQHGGVDLMSEWLLNSNIVVAEICLDSLIKVCCQNKQIEITKKTSNYKIEGIIDMIDMSLHESIDDKFDCLLIYQDKETKFVQLRPIRSADLVDSISNELIHLFSDLGPPECITVSSALYSLFENILRNRLNVFFSPKISLRICEKSACEVTRAVQAALSNWLCEAVENKWCVGCFFVQWKLNNTEDKNGKTAFKTVFEENIVSDDKVMIQEEDTRTETDKELIEDYILNNPALKMPPDLSVE